MLIKFKCHINSEEFKVKISKWDHFRHKLHFYSQIYAFLKMDKYGKPFLLFIMQNRYLIYYIIYLL